MDRLADIYEITREMEQLFEQEISHKNRAAIISEANLLIEKRGNLINKLTHPFTEEEKQTGEKLVTMNDHIRTKMDMLFGELKKEMKQVKKQKSSTRNYMNPYRDVRVMDGMFLDSKK